MPFRSVFYLEFESFLIGTYCRRSNYVFLQCLYGFSKSYRASGAEFCGDRRDESFFQGRKGEGQREGTWDCPHMIRMYRTRVLWVRYIFEPRTVR